MIRHLAFCFGFFFLIGAAANAQVMTDMGPGPQPVMQTMAPAQAGPACGQSYFDGGCQGGDNCGTECNQCMDCCRYIKTFGGWTRLEDFDTFNQQTAVNGTFDDGFGVGGALGRKVGQRLNLELEFAYRNNETDELSADFGQRIIRTDWDGEVRTYSGMTNLIVEGCRSACRINPYAGAGAGFAFVNADVSSQFGDYNIDDTGFAYQFIGGVSRAISCRADVFVEYRYFAVEDNEVKNRIGECIDDFDYRTHNVFFGVRMCR